VCLEFAKYCDRLMVMFVFLRANYAVELLVFGVLAFLFRFETYINGLEVSIAIAFLHLFEHENVGG
jgi:hypothetical protein